MPRVNRHKARYRAYKLHACDTLSKGIANRKIIARFLRGDSEYTLHATKGYRYATIQQAENELLASLMESIN